MDGRAKGASMSHRRTVLAFTQKSFPRRLPSLCATLVSHSYSGGDASLLKAT